MDSHIIRIFDGRLHQVAGWRNPEIPTEMLAFDLRHNPTAWVDMPTATLLQVLHERINYRTIRRLRTNAIPLVLSVGDAMTQAPASPDDCAL